MQIEHPILSGLVENARRSVAKGPVASQALDRRALPGLARPILKAGKGLNCLPARFPPATSIRLMLRKRCDPTGSFRTDSHEVVVPTTKNTLYLPQWTVQFIPGARLPRQSTESARM